MTGDQDESRDVPGGAPDVPGVELGDGIETLLADPLLWEEPTGALGERIVVAIGSEATNGPAAGKGRRSSWIRPAVLGAAAVVMFLLGGVVVLSAIGGSPGDKVFAAELVPTGLVPDVDGSIEVTSFSSGLRIDLDAPSLPRRENDQFYEAWLRTADGRLIPVGTFHAGDGVVLWAGIERDRIVAFTITLERAALPDDADQASSGDVVLKVAITP